MSNRISLILGLLFIISCGTQQKKNETVSSKKIDSDTLKEEVKDSIVEDKNVKDTVLVLATDEKGNFGYQDTTGQWVIAPKYQLAGDFSEKLAPVLLEGKWQLIDKKGKTIQMLAKVKPIVLYNELSGEESVMPISERALPVQFPDGKRGFLKLFNGKFTEKFDDVQPFSNGRAAIRKGDKWGYITIDGKYLVKPKYDNALSFSDNRAIISIDGIAGVIDVMGEVVVPFKFKNAFPFKEGISFVTESEEYRDYYMIDLNGKEISKDRFDSVYGLGFENGECEVMKAGKCLVIDKNGKKLRENKKGCQEGC